MWGGSWDPGPTLTDQVNEEEEQRESSAPEPLYSHGRPSAPQSALLTVRFWQTHPIGTTQMMDASRSLLVVL